jgi:hypothetical protein
MEANCEGRQSPPRAIELRKKKKQDDDQKVETCSKSNILYVITYSVIQTGYPIYCDVYGGISSDANLSRVRLSVASN